MERFPEPAFSLLQRRVFNELEQDANASGPVPAAKTGTTAAARAHPPMFRLGAYERGELVGWSYGWIERDNVFYMANSGVVETHRRRGIYTMLIKGMLRHASSVGASAIRSRHSVVNRPVIIAKLREGFIISGLSQSARMGTLVELTMHLDAELQALYGRRALPCRS